MKTLRRTISRSIVVCLTLSLTLVVFTIWPQGAASHRRTPIVSTYATGLDNPRGLKFGPDGKLYVAEAGKGGSNHTEDFMNFMVSGTTPSRHNDCKRYFLTGSNALA